MSKSVLHHSLTAALVAGALSLAHAGAAAGEVTLFTETRFAGGDVTFNSAVPDLARIGFNDRASSVVVRSGRWELCEHANFGGECFVLERGDYAQMRGMNDRISSLREIEGRDRDPRRRGWEAGRDGDGPDWREGGRYDVGQSGQYDEREGGRYDEREGGRYGERYGEREGGRYDEREGGWRDERYRGPAVELYRKAEFRKDRRDLNDAVLRDFNAIGFNDRVQSLVIRYGQWEFCEHPDFRGNCRVYGPGRHAHLGDLSSRISSMRRVR